MIYINIRYDYLKKLIDNNTHKIQLYKTIYVLRHIYTHVQTYVNVHVLTIYKHVCMSMYTEDACAAL